jgi:hypothetical protein
VCFVGGCLAGLALFRPTAHVGAAYLEPESAPTGV